MHHMIHLIHSDTIHLIHSYTIHSYIHTIYTGSLKGVEQVDILAAVAREEAVRITRFMLTMHPLLVQGTV